MKFTGPPVNRSPIHVTRRFLIGLSAALVLSAVGLGCNPRVVAEKIAEKGEAGTTWKTVIVSDKEPGEPLIISFVR
jgi:hypothetical protein